MSVDFFIRRPVFSMVLAILIVLAGAVCVPFLPIAQFPQIAPPTVQVSAYYTGASAEVVEQTVTSPLEKQINGVEGMTYMSSMSAADGSSSITVTFDIGYDLDIAAVDVENRVSTAMPQLPEEVTRMGVSVTKESTDMILAISLLSPDRTLDDLYLSNYADINVIDVLKRVPGVGDVRNLGEKKYSMRIWLDPDKLTSLGLTAADVAQAVRDQNLQAAAGMIGQPPSPAGQTFTFTVTTQGRLSEPGEFEDIIVRTRADGSVLRLRDVARVELGAESYGSFSKLSGKNSCTVGVYQLPDANALDVAQETRKKMEELAARFPKGMEHKIAYDTTMFVTESIKEVVTTLLEAMALVFLVVYLFLQKGRVTLIPALTIPVSLVGTFALLAAFGFSINTLTLFGLVLAIGLVVDDAIVVVENVSRSLEEKDLSPREATRQAMREVTGPIVATTLVLMAVFVPVAFMPGLSGQLYKQFALTIAISVGISAVNALTLSPSLCALLLRRETPARAWVFRKFNQGFDRFTAGYAKIVRVSIRGWLAVLAVFLVLLGLTWFLMGKVRTGFVPDEDQGFFLVAVMGPEGASLERTEKVTDKIGGIIQEIPGVRELIMIGGFNMITGSQDFRAATAFVMLDPWDERRTPALSLNSILASVYGRTRGITEALVLPFNPPPIKGLSATGGFEFELQDYTAGDFDALDGLTRQLIGRAAERPELTPLSTTFAVNYPQFFVDLDRTKARSLGIPVSDVFSTLQTCLGSLYINDFNKFGRVYRVFLQAENEARSDRDDISRLYVRTDRETMVPLSALVEVKGIRGVQAIKHYNLFRTAPLNGGNTPSYSSGQAIQAMEELARETLPDGYGYEWTGVAYQEIESGGMAPYIFGLALVFVFLFLAAQYESWTMPLMILLAVPLAILGALTAQWLRGLNNDVYCQIGLVMLIGLASKNAILIVEFARNLREQGAPIVEAAVEAARLRLRPILMTAFAFILGVVPLVVAQGAGAASRHSLGTAVFGGMIASTFLSLVLVPVLYVVIEKLRERGKPAAETEPGKTPS